jgi:hypothetical protein
MTASAAHGRVLARRALGIDAIGSEALGELDLHLG